MDTLLGDNTIIPARGYARSAALPLIINMSDVYIEFGSMHNVHNTGNIIIEVNVFGVGTSTESFHVFFKNPTDSAYNVVGENLVGVRMGCVGLIRH